jgi:hypothetical protein
MACDPPKPFQSGGIHLTQRVFWTRILARCKFKPYLRQCPSVFQQRLSQICSKPITEFSRDGLISLFICGVSNIVKLSRSEACFLEMILFWLCSRWHNIFTLSLIKNIIACNDQNHFKF